jgi:hypothetical protein
MDRPELSEGLVWRKKNEKEYFKFIYFKKQYRGRRIRGSSGTSDPKEAEARLRKKLNDIDHIDIYRLPIDRTFREGAEKLIREFQGSPSTLRMYADQADILDPFIGDVAYPVIVQGRARTFH